MKPADFNYYAPTSVAEALEELDRLGYNGKVIAGGQSLIPAMNFRMARPPALVDLNNIPELSYIKPTEDGGLLIGTMTRDSDVEHSPLVEERAPLVVEAMPNIGHPQIRNRGTFGGAIAHADPAGQLPGVAVTLEAKCHIRSKTGDRWVNANDFFQGPFMTVIEPQEMLVEIKIPGLEARTGTCYLQVERQKGAQAQVAVCVLVTLNENLAFKKVNVVMLCVGERPLLTSQGPALLTGQAVSAELIAKAAKTIAEKEIDPGSDIHSTNLYRSHVAEVLVRRAIATAVERARKKGA